MGPESSSWTRFLGYLDSSFLASMDFLKLWTPFLPVHNSEEMSNTRKTLGIIGENYLPKALTFRSYSIQENNAVTWY